MRFFVLALVAAAAVMLLGVAAAEFGRHRCETIRFAGVMDLGGGCGP